MHPCQAGQIALRFPEDGCIDPEQHPDIAKLIVRYIHLTMIIKYRIMVYLINKFNYCKS